METHIDLGIYEGKQLVVHVSGRATAEYCPEFGLKLRNFFSDSNIQSVYFETSEASYMDSSFIGMILFARKHFASFKESRVFLLNPTPEIVEIFELMGLADLIPSVYRNDVKCSYEHHLDKKLENTVADMRTLLEAHQNIMETSPQNRERFCGVESALKQQLEKTKQLKATREH